MMLDPVTLAQMRRTQRSSMMHSCTIEHYDWIQDSGVTYGDPVVSVCGVDFSSAPKEGEVYDGIETVIQMRFPYGTCVCAKDRVTITASFGQRLDVPKIYEIIRVPDTLGPSGIQAEAREMYS